MQGIRIPAATGTPWGAAASPRPKFGWGWGWPGHQSVETLAAVNLKPTGWPLPVTSNDNSPTLLVGNKGPAKASPAGNSASSAAKPPDPLNYAPVMPNLPNLSARRRRLRTQTNLNRGNPGRALPALPPQPPQQVLYRYLMGHLPRIHAESVRQDMDHKGDEHYINLETLGQPAQGGLSESERTFDKVSAAFSEERLLETARQWRREPLSVERLSGQTNVFTAIVKRYEELVGVMTEAKATERASANVRAGVARRLDTTLGELMHYTADLFQPLHSTAFFDWPLQHTWQQQWPGAQKLQNRRDMHRFIEHQTYSKSDYVRQADAVVASPTLRQQMTLPYLKRVLAREIENSYLAVFDIAQKDQEARKSTTEPAHYFYYLQSLLAPMAQQQIAKSARLIADMIYSAFMQAGRPELSLLPVPPSSKS